MDTLFNDWKRFCLVLREIARGENGCPLLGPEAQQRAQAILTECGYAWRRSTANGRNITPEGGVLAHEATELVDRAKPKPTRARAMTGR